MKAVNFAAALHLPDSLKIQDANLLGERLVHNVDFSRLKVGVFNNDLESLLSFQRLLVDNNVAHIDNAAGRVLSGEHLRFVQVNHVRNKLVLVWISFFFFLLLFFFVFFLVELRLFCCLLLFIIWDDHLGPLFDCGQIGLEPLGDTELHL